MQRNVPLVKRMMLFVPAAAMALRMAGVLSVPQVAKAFCKVTCAGLEMERFVPVASTLVMVAIKSRWLVE